MTEGEDLICQYYGGSHSYGLNTPDSDVDYRGVYALDRIQDIIDPHSHDTKKRETLVNTLESDKEDSVYYEFRHFLHLLKKGNTGSLEMLFNSNWQKVTPIFLETQANLQKLINPEQLRVSIEGYAMSEYQLAIGARTGKLGGKRQEQITKYGFSPKNFTNLFRLLYCAEQFFENAIFPVNLTGSYIHPQLMEVKTYPERFTKDRLIKMFDEKMDSMFKSWEINKTDICRTYSYDPKVATRLILKCYLDKLDREGHSKLKYYIGKLIP